MNREETNKDFWRLRELLETEKDPLKKDEIRREFYRKHTEQVFCMAALSVDEYVDFKKICRDMNISPNKLVHKLVTEFVNEKLKDPV